MRFIALALALAPLVAHAEEPRQAFVSLTILKDDAVINSQGFVASDEPGFYSAGNQNNYPNVICGNGTATLRSVAMFSGITVGHQLTDKGVEVQINRYEVDSPSVISASIAKCQAAAPSQRLLMNTKEILPLDSLNGRMPLGNGYSLRYETSSEG